MRVYCDVEHTVNFKSRIFVFAIDQTVFGPHKCVSTGPDDDLTVQLTRFPGYFPDSGSDNEPPKEATPEGIVLMGSTEWAVHVKDVDYVFMKRSGYSYPVCEVSWEHALFLIKCAPKQYWIVGQEDPVVIAKYQQQVEEAKQRGDDAVKWSFNNHQSFEVLKELHDKAKSTKTFKDIITGLYNIDLEKRTTKGMNEPMESMVEKAISAQHSPPAQTDDRQWAEKSTKVVQGAQGGRVKIQESATMASLSKLRVPEAEAQAPALPDLSRITYLELLQLTQKTSFNDVQLTDLLRQEKEHGKRRMIIQHLKNLRQKLRGEPDDGDSPVSIEHETIG